MANRINIPMSAMLATSGKQSGNHKYWEPVTVRKTQDFTLAVLVPLGISDVYTGFTR
jgi:hypothetical protein